MTKTTQSKEVQTQNGGKRSMRQSTSINIKKKLQAFINPHWIKRKQQIKEDMDKLKGILCRQTHGAMKIKNIRDTVTVEQLGETLEKHGKIKLLNLCNTDKIDSNANHAYVYFKGAGKAKAATASLHNSVLLGKVVKVSYLAASDLRPKQFMVQMADVIETTAL